MKKDVNELINQRIKNAINAVIEQQIAEKNPAETLETIERLQSEGFTREESYALVGHLVSLEVAEELVGQQGINMQRYIAALEQLPKPFAKERMKSEEED